MNQDLLIQIFDFRWLSICFKPASRFFVTPNMVQIIRCSPPGPEHASATLSNRYPTPQNESSTRRGSQLIVPGAIITTWCLGGVRRGCLWEAAALVCTRRGLVTICARSRRGIKTGSRSVKTAAVAGRSATARLVGRCAAAAGVPS